MKKLIILIISLTILFTLANSVNAGLSIRPMFNFGIGVGGVIDNSYRIGTTNYGNDLERDSFGNNLKDQKIMYSLGWGLIPAIDLDLNFGKCAGLFIGVGYSRGFERTTCKIRDPYYQQYHTYKMKGSYLGVKFGLKLRKELKRLIPYVSAGVLFAFAGKATYTQDYTDYGVRTSYIEEFKFYPGVGFTGSIGVDIKITRRISLFTQITGNLLSIKVKSSKITKWVEDGFDWLPILDTNEKEFVYVKDAKDDDPNDTSNPQISPTWAEPFHSIQIAVGLSLNF